ncbi:carbohydrate-binding protein [Lutibacter sp. HS1-25]|uniref:carbohydrate-binding protein n=1 Tax=Lutibacter sp. HS1-25 TaxID=2485000 RepID=UPI0010135E85|nr:carbohydrate-binding protein [Lutibacter sp. HS1-25]RXP62723.1 carbohydrate-binding protein [Lutibacter sp. HS1-25]
MKHKLFFLLFIATTTIFGQLTHYDWPNADGQALISDKYDVFVKNGNDEEIKLEVLMSNAIYENDHQANQLMGRTFSFASVSFDKLSGSNLTFRVVKKFGNPTTDIEISPKSYGITPTISSNEVSFSINDSGKYISVNFVDAENKTSPSNWIKHMLTIFVDPPEENAPNKTDPGVVVYSNSTTPTELDNASIIYFEPGYHNLKNYQYAGIIDDSGLISLKNGQKMYLAGGAFVEGRVGRQDYNNTYQKIYGRGILSGRQYEWQDANGNKPYGNIVELGKYAEVNGIMIMESPQHGIVAPNNATITNLKFLGWHANNDAIRVGAESEIKNSFIRAVDDFFYNFNVYVHDCILWAGHNGAILTYGWGSYNAGASTLDNIDIINPEWTGLGNNNGLVASQNALDFKPYSYNAGYTTTTIKNIRIEGRIPGIVNLKPRSSSNGVIDDLPVTEESLGYLGDLVLENITINKQFDKNRIKGKENATITGNKTFFTKNVTFKNITIDGTKLNDKNSSIYFDIETSTTENIVFDKGSDADNSEIEIETFSNNVQITHLTQNALTSVNKGIVQNDIKDIKPGGGQWFAAGYSTEGEFAIQSTGGNQDEHVVRTSDVQYARGFAYVYNNKNQDAFGVLNMSFDYFWKSPLTGDRISYRVWGIKDPEQNGIDGYVRLTGGSGAFGDNDATNYLEGIDGTQLAGSTELGVAEEWTKIEYTISASNFDYIVIVFSGAFGTIQASPTTIFGIDNVSIPKTNPSIYDDKIQIPSLVQAEDFTGNNETTSEITADVDGDKNINFTAASNWVDYEVYVSNTDTYKTEFRIAAASNWSIDIMSNSKVLKTITGESTGGLQNWETVRADIEISKGLQTLRIANSATPLNLNWVKFSTIDDDKDGIENDLDQCPDTPIGTAVDEKGCPIFKIDSSNFTITATSETCPSKSNGKISISAKESYDYVAIVNNVNYNFTDNNLTISDLAPGDYDICIGITGKTYKQCYIITVNAGNTIAAKTSVKGNKVYVDMEQGTAPFEVLINDELKLTTQNTTFELDVKNGDKINIKTAVTCEGVFNKSVELTNGIYVYPNPSNGIFNVFVEGLNINQKVTLQLINTTGKNVYSQQVESLQKPINVTGINSGVYFLKVITVDEILIKKIIIK